MTEGVAPSGAPVRRAPRRWRRRCGWLAAILVTLGVAAWAARDELAEAALLRWLPAVLGSKLDLDGSVESISVRIDARLSRARVSLRNLHLVGRGEDPVLDAASVTSAEVELDLRGLLAGREVLTALSVEGGRIELDLRPSDGPDAEVEWPETLPAGEYLNLDLLVRLPLERELHARGVAVRVQPAPAAPAAQRFIVDCPELTLTAPESETRSRGALHADLAWRDGVVTAEPGGWLGAAPQLLLQSGSRVDLRGLARGQVLGALNFAAGTATLTVSGEVLRRQGREHFVGELRLAGLRSDRLPSVFARDLELPVVELAVQGTLDLPLDEADLLALLATTRATLDLSVHRPDTADRLELVGHLGDGRFVLERGRAVTRGGELLVRAARMDFGTSWSATRLALDGEADFVDIGPLGELLAPLLPAQLAGRSLHSPWSGALTAAAVVSGELGAPHLELSVSAQQLVAADMAVGGLALVGRVERAADLVTAVSASLSADALVLDGHDFSEVHLTGSFDGRQLHVREASAESDGTRVSLTASLDAWPPESTTPWHLHLQHFDLQRGELDLHLREPVDLVVHSGAFSFSPVELLGHAGRLRVELERRNAADSDEHVGRLSLQLSALALELLPPFLRPAGWPSARLDSSLQLDWQAARQPPGTGVRNAAAQLASVSDFRLTAGLLLGAARDGQTGLSAESAELALELSGSPTAPVGHLQLQAHGLAVPLPPLVLEALAALDQGEGVRVLPRPEELAASAHSVRVGQHGRLTEPTPQAAPAEPVFGPGALSLALRFGEVLELQHLRLDAPAALSLQAEGSVATPLDLVAAAAGHSALDLDAALDVQGSLRALDIGRLSAWIPDVRRLSGELVAQGQITGSLREPQAVGLATLRHGELRLATGVPALDRLDAAVELSPRELRLRHCRGELGAAPFELSGRLLLDGDGAVELQFRGDDLLVWRGQGVKLRADVDLAVRGPLAGPTARGRVVLRDSRIARNINLLSSGRSGGLTTGRLELFSFEEAPLAGLRFHVDVSCVEPFRVDNNLVRAALVPELLLTGTGAAPILTGAVHVASARVALPASVVSLAGGRILFLEADPARPRLELSGSSSVRGHEIEIRISGAWDDPVLGLSSVPPLSSEDVLLLLLTGQPPRGQGGSSADGIAATGTVAVYLGQDLLARWFSSSAEVEDGLLDRLDIDYSQDVTARGTTVLVVSYRLTAAEREQGPILFLHGEKDVYDDVNFGLRWQFRLE